MLHDLMFLAFGLALAVFLVGAGFWLGEDCFYWAWTREGRRRGFAAVAVAVVFLVLSAILLHQARAQDIASYTGSASDLRAVTAAAGKAQLPMQGVYVDSRLQFTDFDSNAQWAANSIAATCPPASCSPMLGLPMAGSGQNADAAFKQIASGAEDDMIRGVLQAFADKGYQNILLRPGWEMNGTWYAWSVTEANAADFKAAFQRIAMIAHDFQDAIVTVAFNPNIGTSIPLNDYYPGNAAVDVLGPDSYGSPIGGPMPLDTNGSDTNLTIKYLADFAKANGKPFVLPETGAAWNDTTFATELAQALKQWNIQVYAAGLWDNNDGSGKLDWTSNPAATAAWAAVAAIIEKSTPPQSTWQAAQPVASSTAPAQQQPAPDLPDAPLTIEQVAQLATLPAIEPTAVPDLGTLAAMAQAGVPKQAGPSGDYTPPTPPDGPSTALSVADDFGVLADTTGAHRIAVSGSGNTIVATGGPEAVDVSGHGNAVRTGLFNDTITLHTSGNTVDGGGGEDTVVLDLPATQQPPTEMQIAGLSKAGNTIVAPPPDQGVLTIKGRLQAIDKLNVAKSLAGTVWDGTLATMGNYLSVTTAKAGTTLSVEGKPVVVLVDAQTADVRQLLTAGADL